MAAQRRDFHRNSWLGFPSERFFPPLSLWQGSHASSRRLRETRPLHHPSGNGSVSVNIQMNLQSSAENPLNLVFTYNQDPFVEAINPSTGPTVGQTSVTLVGR